ncbi:MAG TPA: hypothetical protein VNP04_01060 [Alphaproteobacteria bacterium]|nr:hypothetical protein [Alphaproteobacteria bacterium]
MDLVKSIIPVCVGVAIGMATVWFTMPGVVADGPAAVVEQLVDLDHRLGCLERAVHSQMAAMPVDLAREIEDLRQELHRLSEQVTSLTHASDAPEGAPGSATPSHIPQDVALLGLNTQPGTGGAGIEVRELEPLVADAVAALAPRYLEEQVSRLYAAEKQADEAAQLETEQRRREETRERRLAQLVNDLQSFVPNLTATQVEAVAQAIQEQWEVMASLRQQASDRGLLSAPGDILRQAREITDEKLYAVLSGPQLEAFRHWRETRFGAPGILSR